MRVSLIVATAADGVIGREGDLPWRMSSDLRRFKRLTMGHHIIMGRRTYESLGRPLPGRTMIVLTRQAGYEAPGAEVASDLAAALQMAAAAGEDEAFVIGGGEVYRQALAEVDRIYLTRVEAAVEGDTHFPTVDWKGWQLVEQEHHLAGERDEYPSTFCVYDRRGAAGAQAANPAAQAARP